MQTENNQFNWIIHTSEQTKRGLFFRSPFFKKYYDCYGAWFNTDEERIPDPDKPGLLLRILNLFYKWGELKERMTADNFGGFYLRVLRSPIYFQREESESLLMTKDGSFKVSVKGFCFGDEKVGGECQKEVTTIENNGVVVRRYASHQQMSNSRNFNMKYEHVLKKYAQDLERLNQEI